MAYNYRKKDQWNIDYIKVIYSKEPNNYYVFRVEKWVEKNQKMNALITLEAIAAIVPVPTEGKSQPGAPPPPGKMIYHVSTITGEHKFAGTDAKVFIQLKGTDGISDIHQLHNDKSRKQQFERGQMDHFHVNKIKILI
jgi:hypothetical protein